MLLIGVLLAVAVGLLWTVAGYVMGKAPKQGVDVTLLLFLYNLVLLPVGAGIGLSPGHGLDLSSAAAKVLALSVVAGGFLCCVQLELISRAMQRGPNGIIWSIVQSGFVFPFFMGAIWFGVPLTPLRIAGLAAILAALYLLGTGEREERKTGKWRMLAFAAFVATGACQVFFNLPSYYEAGAKIPGIWRQVFCAAGMCLGAAAIAAFRRGAPAAAVHKLGSGRMWAYIGIMTGLTVVEGEFLVFRCMDALAKAGAGSIAYPIMVCSCIPGFELYSISVLKEKRTPAQYAGTALCLLGAAAITG